MSLPLATFNGYKGLLIFSQKDEFTYHLLVLRTIKMEIFFKTKVQYFFCKFNWGVSYDDIQPWVYSKKTKIMKCHKVPKSLMFTK